MKLSSELVEASPPFHIPPGIRQHIFSLVQDVSCSVEPPTSPTESFGQFTFPLAECLNSMK